ncbi:mutator-like element transposase [Fusarium mundagurra]|uniref:Mutator-like element transposase n=1 Tax=Fusarium mundagurra TaxID=1567541 RepID=A0A8H5YCX6_9HYPO|nr:mutator-like element transposase [Fusarium mundagurra]
MNPINAINLFPDDVLPPEGHFPSREALVTAINAWARERGYAFVVKNSWKTPSGRRGVIYTCDRGTKPPSTTRERVRNTASRYTGCLFSITAKEALHKTSWSLSYRPDQKYHEHNHEPSHPLAHPTHRILSGGDKQIVKQLTSCGSAPKDIISHLPNTSTTLATQQDIYNCIAESKRELLEGQSNIHALANQLESEGFWSRIRLEEGTVTAVLFAHPKSLAYLKSYTEVLILDCTYKTNKYKMPLLNAIGVDACQRSFCIAFAFLSGEEEGDYNWALAQLRSIYVADAKDYKGQEKWKDFYSSWHDLVASSNEDIYYQKLSDFKKKYIPDHVSQVGYITETWLDLYKEKFVKAWVDQHLHFNQYVTSRCEGIHQLIKSYLKSSQLNLFDAWRHIKLVVTNQVAELESNQARQQASFPLKLSGSLYGNIRGWISHEALRLVDNQRARLLHQLPACTGTFNRTLVNRYKCIISTRIGEFSALETLNFS